LRTLLYLMFHLSCCLAYSQDYSLQVISKNINEQKIIDSLSFQKKHQNLKSIYDENKSIQQKLLLKGYFENNYSVEKTNNDKEYIFEYVLGKKIKSITIYQKKQDSNMLDLLLEKDSVTLAIEKSGLYIQELVAKLERKGFSMAKINLKNIQQKNQKITAELNISLGKQRKVNQIIINGYTKFPVGFIKSLENDFKNTTFNQSNLDKLYTTINSIRFVKQIKYPEILFTTDSTKVYVYLEKSKANNFDGYIGFNNSESSNLTFNGYIDLALKNILNSGEQLAINWRNNGQDQRSFNLDFELPYIFKSKMGVKTQLNIFRQDSTFQNTQTAIDLGYYFKSNKKVLLGYQSSESSDIQNANSSLLNDYKNSFITCGFDYINYNTDSFLFPEKLKFFLKTGFGSRQSKIETNNQYFIHLTLENNFNLNSKNSINIKSQNSYLNSNNYLTNELYRFGGVNSIRGFVENSLQGNVFLSLLSEYRYLITSNLYIHSIIDYGYLKDNTINSNEQLTAFGLGIGILSKNGLLKVVYSNGNSDSNVKLSNSLVQLSFKAVF
jgi:outer membrane protein assembly factor BamA